MKIGSTNQKSGKPLSVDQSKDFSFYSGPVLAKATPFFSTRFQHHIEVDLIRKLPLNNQPPITTIPPLLSLPQLDELSERIQ